MKGIATVVAVLLVGATPALAAPEDVANEISEEVMSPFCPGVTLEECPSQAALDLRQKIRTWAEQGWSRERIMSELEDSFGSRIYAMPQDSKGLGAWALPVGALLLGILLSGSLATKWTRRRRYESTPSIGAADRARVERELAALREETS